MSAISEKANGKGNVVDPLTDREAQSSLQQLKAKKNKSNLFLIKSYSFIENNNNNSTNSNNNCKVMAKMSTVSAPSSDLLQSPDMEPFPDIGSLMLAQVTADGIDESTKKSELKKPKKIKQPKAKTKTKTKTTKAKTNAKRNNAEAEDEMEEAEPINDQEAQLLRRKIHEYEELLDQTTPTAHATGTGTLPRPQSLPAKVHFETAALTGIRSSIEPIVAPMPAKHLGANIKRESFIRQSLQSIRRSFGSSKHASKLTMLAATPSPLPSPGSSSASTTSTSSSTVSSSSTSSSGLSSTAISILTKAPTHNHLLDEYVPTPVVLLLNDDIICEQRHNLDQDTDATDGAARGSTRSANCVSTVANVGSSGICDERATTSMAPLQLSAARAAAAVNDKNTTAATTTTSLDEQKQLQHQLQLQHEHLQQRRQQYEQHYPVLDSFGAEESSLPQSYSSTVVPLQLSGSANSLGSSSNPSPRNSQSHSQSGNGSVAGSGVSSKGNNTAKQHEQQSSAVAVISSTSAAAGAGAGHATTTGAAVTNSPEKEKDKEKEKEKEKEKKRKEVSSSRVKKFHRHFSQVSKDEKLINYFSCALVGDIPLQGHLYITDEHFAFYSNVFGYVTKVVIPTTSVTKISKEKTAKIIPNAVGVATADERHVFGSFISRESAFRLMNTVCRHLATGSELLPKPLAATDVELTEEYFIDDDSSCSISGNESPPQLRDAAIAAAVAVAVTTEQQMLLRHRNIHDRHSDLQGKSTLNVPLEQSNQRSSAPPIVQYVDGKLPPAGAGVSSQHGMVNTASQSSSTHGSTSSSSSPVTVVGAAPPPATVPVPPSAAVNSIPPSSLGNRLNGVVETARSQFSLRLPTFTELHILYLGIMLAVMLALFSVFLLYRILDIEAKTSLYNTPIEFHLRRSGNDEDIFAEALRWQKELQDRSTAEAQHILSKNLEQISKVRRSLETLSMLIHDRRADFNEQPTETVIIADPSLDASQISSDDSSSHTPPQQ